LIESICSVPAITCVSPGQEMRNSMPNRRVYTVLLFVRQNNNASAWFTVEN
jgi:hypothetical protein